MEDYSTESSGDCDRQVYITQRELLLRGPLMASPSNHRLSNDHVSFGAFFDALRASG